ncbi:hypothetical protein JCM14244_16350 [Venenivibrio stagnispumantis]|uniref:Uncharacterized protein n=1 Tax=Venenivibrio stagnispumantis TaxID=407998 RepID=A0AA45WPI7_9AQUI|nr:hypothetical protein [Venenivibrio stagnispumantis]MCW4574011.1 hypothetical protein [Venenivibrio stagnispumantis]SMP21186.1 hypothetical protein SAMN06264868_12229 [Venenivibrio stagnispumantis]
MKKDSIWFIFGFISGFILTLLGMIKKNKKLKKVEKKEDEYILKVEENLKKLEKILNQNLKGGNK